MSPAGDALYEDAQKDARARSLSLPAGGSFDASTFGRGLPRFTRVASQAAFAANPIEVPRVPPNALIPTVQIPPRDEEVRLEKRPDARAGGYGNMEVSAVLNCRSILLRHFPHHVN